MLLVVRPWDLMLIGLLVSPLVSGILFLNTMNSVLTVEVVPVDQGDVFMPAIGDRVEVYGTWVMDHHVSGLITWNEIHPAVFIRNLTIGLEGGVVQCRALENVHDPERLTIIDPALPCRWAHGRVDYKFQWSDGDWHLDLVLDTNDSYLVRGGVPQFPIYLTTLQTLLFATTLGFGVPYVGIAILRPDKTLLGRTIKRLFHKLT